MALKYFDGFDAYSVNEVPQIWDAGGDDGFINIGFGTGRFGGYSLRNNSPGRGVMKVFSSSHATWIIGCAFYWNFFTGGSPGNDVINLIQLRDNTTKHISLKLINGNVGNLFIQHGNGSTLATTTNVPLVIARWYYIEFKVTIDDTVGSYEVRIDGVVHPQLTATNVDTRNGGNPSADRVMFSGITTFFTNTDYYMDDIYILDGSGPAPKNDYLGDMNVPAIAPDGNGNSSQFIGSDGNTTDNYLLIDELPANSDTDYVQSDVIGNKDTYTYQDLSAVSGTIYGVMVMPFAKKTDTGARAIRTLARLSGTEIDNGTDINLGTTYAYYPTIFESKPGGGDWTITDVNNAEFGHKLTV